MPYCSNCGNQLGEKAQFCPNCGTRQSAPATPANPGQAGPAGPAAEPPSAQPPAPQQGFGNQQSPFGQPTTPPSGQTANSQGFAPVPDNAPYGQQQSYGQQQAPYGQQPSYGSQGAGQSPYAPQAYGSPNAQPVPKGRNPMVWIAAAVGALLLLVVLALIGAVAVHQNSSSNKSASTGTKPSPTASSSTKHSVSGGTKKAISWTDSQTGVTATVSRPFVDAHGDSSLKPKAGQEFALFKATLRNGSSTGRQYNPEDFHVVVNGRQLDTCTGAGIPNSDGPGLSYGSIDAGATKQGNVGCQVPTGTHSLVVSWDDGSTLDPPHQIARLRLQ